MKKIVSDEVVRKINNSKKYIGKFAIWLVVGVVALSVLAILVFEHPMEVIGKFIGSLLLIALASAVSFNNIMRANKDAASVVIFALACLVFNVIWTICWMLLIWQPEWAETSTYVGGFVGYSFHPSMLYKTAAITSCLSFLCCGNSNIMAIEEYNKKSLIRPLKITATICLSYVACYVIAMISSNFDIEFTGIVMRLGILAGFAAVAWVILVIMAVVVSGNARIDQTYTFSPASTNSVSTNSVSANSAPANPAPTNPTPSAPTDPTSSTQASAAPQTASVSPHYEPAPHHEPTPSHHAPIPLHGTPNHPAPASPKSEAELRAEIRAEIEAEMRQEAIAKEKLARGED